MIKKKTIYTNEDDPNYTYWTIEHLDSNNGVFYFEDSNGIIKHWKYDQDGNLIFDEELFKKTRVKLAYWKHKSK